MAEQSHMTDTGNREDFEDSPEDDWELSDEVDASAGEGAAASIEAIMVNLEARDDDDWDFPVSLFDWSSFSEAIPGKLLII